MSTYEEINESIDKLFESINAEDITWINELDKTINLFINNRKIKEFYGIFLPVYKNMLKNELKDDNRKKLDKININLRRIVELEPNTIIDKLRSSGYGLSKNEAFKNSIQGQMYKLLEQVRLGKRDNVIGMLMRIFFINKEKFSDDLIEAIKPMYDDSMFKAFMYSFLGSFTENKQSDNENKEEKE